MGPAHFRTAELGRRHAIENIAVEGQTEAAADSKTIDGRDNGLVESEGAKIGIGTRADARFSFRSPPAHQESPEPVRIMVQTSSSAFKLDEYKIQEITNLGPDMLLLTGGTDGGDSGTILHNARLLAHSSLSVPIVVAGNKAVATEVCEILRVGGKEIRRAGNVMPQSGKLEVESAHEEIRKLFMERITHAKGLDDQRVGLRGPTHTHGRAPGRSSWRGRVRGGEWMGGDARC